MKHHTVSPYPSASMHGCKWAVYRGRGRARAYMPIALFHSRSDACEFAERKEKQHG